MSIQYLESYVWTRPNAPCECYKELYRQEGYNYSPAIQRSIQVNA